MRIKFGFVCASLLLVFISGRFGVTSVHQDQVSPLKSQTARAIDLGPYETITLTFAGLTCHETSDSDGKDSPYLVQIFFSGEACFDKAHNVIFHPNSIQYGHLKVPVRSYMGAFSNQVAPGSKLAFRAPFHHDFYDKRPGTVFGVYSMLMNRVGSSVEQEDAFRVGLEAKIGSRFRSSFTKAPATATKPQFVLKLMASVAQSFRRMRYGDLLKACADDRSMGDSLVMIAEPDTRMFCRSTGFEAADSGVIFSQFLKPTAPDPAANFALVIPSFYTGILPTHGDPFPHYGYAMGASIARQRHG